MNGFVGLTVYDTEICVGESNKPFVFNFNFQSKEGERMIFNGTDDCETINDSEKVLNQVLCVQNPVDVAKKKRKRLHSEQLVEFENADQSDDSEKSETFKDLPALMQLLKERALISEQTELDSVKFENEMYYFFTSGQNCLADLKSEHKNKKHSCLIVSKTVVKFHCFNKRHSVQTIKGKDFEDIRNLIFAFHEIKNEIETEQSAQFLFGHEVMTNIANDLKSDVIIRGQQGKAMETYCWNGKVFVNDPSAFKKMIYIKLVEMGKKQKGITYSLKSHIYQDIVPFLTNHQVKFDTNPELLAFNNGVLNVRTGEFKDFEKTDFISKILPYDFQRMSETEIHESECWRMIMTIFVNEEERFQNLKAYGTALIGQNIQNVFVCNGKGGNGKGVLNRLVACCLGPFAFMASCAILSERRQTGANPEIANLSGKRFIVFEEPPCTERIQNETLKELTGGSCIRARDLYSSETERPNYASLFIECNTIPKLKSLPSLADVRRWKLIRFSSSFSSDVVEPDFEAMRFPRVVAYDTDEWRLRNQNVMMNILLKFSMEFYRQPTVQMSAENQRILDEYFKSCDFMTIFIDETLEFREDRNNFVTIKSLFQRYKSSRMFDKLSYAMKREHTEKRMKETLEISAVYGSYFRKRFFLNGTENRSVLVHHGFVQ